MSLLKGWFVIVMTAQTEGGLRLHQKIFLVRTVSKVAGGAAFLSNFMDHFLLVVLFLMALIAALIALCFHQMACLRGVRVMAESAFPFAQGGMDIGFIQSYLFFAMAGKTDFIPLLLE